MCDSQTVKDNGYVMIWTKAQKFFVSKYCKNLKQKNLGEVLAGVV